MADRSFRKEELTVQGIFPNCDTFYGYTWPEVAKFNTPITPKENMKLFLHRKDCYWIPSIMNDINWIYPDIVPDCFACKFEGGIDSFGVEWIPTHPELFLPSFVKPGNPKLMDIADWTTLQFPDIDSWDWEASSIKFKEGLDKDRMNMGVILTSFFERLIALMDFQNAAMALLEDPDSVKAFFDKVADYNISLMEHYVKYYDIGMVFMHDDWGAQRAPFFKFETLRELIVPFYRRVTDRAHQLGLCFIGHCCGNSEVFVPAMIEAGIDIWQCQPNANPDLLNTIKKYGDQIMFDVPIEAPVGATNEEFKVFAEEKFNTMLAGKNVTYSFVDENFAGRQEWDVVAYELARKAAVK